MIEVVPEWGGDWNWLDATNSMAAAAASGSQLITTDCELFPLSASGDSSQRGHKGAVSTSISASAIFPWSCPLLEISSLRWMEAAWTGFCLDCHILPDCGLGRVFVFITIICWMEAAWTGFCLYCHILPDRGLGRVFVFITIICWMEASWTEVCLYCHQLLNGK